MPPNVATILYLGIVAYLFRRDFREKPAVTRAVWIPFVWLFIIMSRAVSEWLAIFGLNVGGSSVEEGSPVDAVATPESCHPLSRRRDMGKKPEDTLGSQVKFITARWRWSKEELP